MEKKPFSLWVIEDDEAQAALICLLMEQVASEIQVKLFRGGNEVLRALGSPPENSRKSIVFLSDLNLLDMSALELLSSLRNRPDTREAPFIVVSGSDDAETRSEAYRQGANAYLAKPFELEDFKTFLQSVVSFWKWIS